MTAAPITPGPPRPTPAAVPRRLRTLPRPRELRPIDPVAPIPPAVARDRARWADCSRGAHVWIATPLAVICQHCPVRADQAVRVQDARRARTAG